MDGEYFGLLTSDDMFEIEPSDRIDDLQLRTEYKKLNLSPLQKIQVSGLLQQMPALVSSEILSKSYILKFPQGISGVCHPIHYKAGGIGTPIQSADGKFVSHASLQSFSRQAVILNAFNVMSIASGQYFLAQITNELKTINKSIDKILEFLYNEKKSELISEVSFVKSAYQNYSSIMEHEQQRLATIVSLQEARKVSVKDIEFYMFDLDSTLEKAGKSEVQSLVADASKIKNSLELSIQLYIMASLLEVYYAQNYDVSYILHVETEASVYISKCEKRILSSFSKLSNYIQGLKEGPLKKIDKSGLEEKVNTVIDSFSDGAESDMLKIFRSSLHEIEKRAEYYITGDGELYLKSV